MIKIVHHGKGLWTVSKIEFWRKKSVETCRTNFGLDTKLFTKLNGSDIGIRSGYFASEPSTRIDGSS
jgi:hypothetical protein